jgi:transposase-like protein
MAAGDGRELAGVAHAVLLDAPGFRRGIVARARPAGLDAELTAHLGAGRDERGAGRTGDRTGARPRALTTRVGTLQVRGPQDRDGTFCGGRRTATAPSRPSGAPATSAASRRW